MSPRATSPTPGGDPPPASSPAGPARPRRRNLGVRLALVGLAALVGLTCLLRPPRFVELIELKIHDWHVLWRGPVPPPPDITVVAIDEASLERIGHWPWPRTRTAELVVRLAEAGARVVMLDLLLNEPDDQGSLALTRSLVERYRDLGLDRTGRPGAEFARTLDEALAAADTDRLLAEVLAAARVVLPYTFIFPPSTAPPLDDDARRLLNRSRLVAFASPEALRAFQPRQAAGVLPPLALFQAAVAGSGYANVVPDADGAIRRAPLVVRFGDGYFPSAVLETARLALDVPRQRVRITAEQRIELGARSLPTDEEGFMHLTYYGPKERFRRLSAGAVLTESTLPAVAGHVVLVGFTALGLMDVRATPFDSTMPGVEIHATALANFMEGRGLRRLQSFKLLEALAILLLVAVPSVALPRLGATWGTTVAVVVALTVVAVGHAGFRSGTLVAQLPLLLALAVAHIGAVTHQVLTEERERRWIKHAFQQYVPAEVVDAVAQNPEALAFGGERRTMTVLFSDIRGYTTFSERHAPEEVVRVLHEYLSEMVEVAFRHKGTLDKFIGDAIMVLFGAPLADPDHAINACRAAVEMKERLDRLNVRWRAEGREPLDTGVGIASGEMVVGNLGSRQRFAYTVIGDNVNLAARLEALTRQHDTSRGIIISDETFARARDGVVTRPLGSVTVKGKHKAVDIYEVLGLAPRDGEGRG
jgi:adenylate cyclase